MVLYKRQRKTQVRRKKCADDEGNGCINGNERLWTRTRSRRAKTDFRRDVRTQKVQDKARWRKWESNLVSVLSRLPRLPVCLVHGNEGVALSVCLSVCLSLFSSRSLGLLPSLSLLVALAHSRSLSLLSDSLSLLSVSLSFSLSKYE